MVWTMVSGMAAFFALTVAGVALVAGAYVPAAGIALVGLFWAGVAAWMYRQTPTN